LSEQINAFLANAHIGRQSNSLALNVLEQMDVIVTGEGGLSRNHLKQHSSHTPQIGLGVVSAKEKIQLVG
jgi:hypothetical protein